MSAAVRPRISKPVPVFAGTELPSREDLTAMLGKMTPQQLEELDQTLGQPRVDWAPFPGPQTMAFTSKADILGYGGAAGGGKSDLLLGVAGLMHYRSVIYRRIFPSLRGLIDRSRQIFNPLNTDTELDHYNESLHRWRIGDTPAAPQLDFASLQFEKDVLAHQGHPRDFHGFDELTEFTEYQLRFVIGWNRTTRPGQRCRVICTFNPPTTKEGRWVVRFFAPWLDDKHPRPAKPGELRWYTTKAGKDIELDGPEPVKIDGEWVTPKSRTFIPASVRDNPALMATGYESTLQALPEPLRSIMLYGSFTAGIEDDPWQLIPTAWVKAAQARWLKAGGHPKPGARIDQLGVDVSRGGRDRTVLTPRYGTFFANQLAYPGRMVEDGDKVVQLAVNATPDPNTLVVVDVVGVGSSAFDGLKRVRPTYAMNGAEASVGKDKSGRLSFVNKRSEWHWKVREMLDPANNIEDPPAIPDDPELLADLTAATWELTRSGIKVESKEDIVQRLGRSPDKGESLIYSAVPCIVATVNLAQGADVSPSIVEDREAGSPWSM